MRRSTTSTRRAMQALDTLAAMYAVLEKARANLDVENSEGDILYADVRAAVEEFNECEHCCRTPWEVSTMPSCKSKKHAAAWRTQVKGYYRNKKESG